MKRSMFAMAALAMAAGLAAPRAEAAKIPVMWGVNHNFDRLADVKMPGEDLGGFELARHSESVMVFGVLGFWVTDKGYALHKGDRYNDITAEELEVLKKAGAVSGEFADGLPLSRWFMGLSGWLALLAVGGYYGVMATRRQRA